MNWQNEMRADILRVVIDKGLPADMKSLGERSYGAWTYSSVDYRLAEDIAQHRQTCGFAFVDPQALPVVDKDGWDRNDHLPPHIREYAGVTFRQEGGFIAAQWSSFAGTFTGNENKTALIATASCACGKYTDVTFLHEADLVDIIRELTR